jgi:Leucine-rich repeat (LRR) protein
MTGFPSLAKLNLGQNKIDNTSVFQKSLLVLQELYLDGNPLIDPVVPSEFMNQLM